MFTRRPYTFRHLEVMNMASNDVLTTEEMKFLDALVELIIMNDRAGDYPAKEPR